MIFLSACFFPFLSTHQANHHRRSWRSSTDASLVSLLSNRLASTTISTLYRRLIQEYGDLHRMGILLSIVFGIGFSLYNPPLPAVLATLDEAPAHLSPVVKGELKVWHVRDREMKGLHLGES